MFEHSFLPCGYGYYLFSESCMNTVNVAMMRWLCGQMLLVFLLSDFLQGSLLADPANCSVTAQTPCKDKCIPITWLCNDQGDCPDGTDEQCDVACRGDENAWQCDNGKCISKRWKCDGVPDCLDGSDELDCVCSGNIQCHSSGKCIDRWEICNGKNDCEDGSDERNCPTYSCMENGVQCKNKVCVMKSWLCNGIDNCGDGSDEELCDDCAEAYKCSNGVCLNGSQICNRENDCPDGSDETRTCGHHCSLLNGECMHHCKDVPWGVICTCQEGWKLQPDRQNCADIDECSFDYNPCHQLCSNSNGSFLCDCVKGFELKGKTVCEVIGHATLMLVAKQGEIGLVDVRMADYQSLLTIDDKPSAIAYYLAKEAYLWITERKTLQVFFIGTVNTNALYPDVGDVSSLSVDWFTGQLYWASLQRKSISVGLIDGRGFINLFEKDIVPDQLVVFPDNRCMYWINYEKKGITTIESAGMDGSDRHVIVFLPMEEPIGLTLDRITWRLYWISKYKESIETIHVNGSGRHTFPDVLQKKQETLGLAVFEGWFFLADNTQLVSLSRNEPREKRLLLSTSNISSFTVLHELQQSTSASPCSSGTCSHLCLLSPVLSKSYKCACPAGLFLLPSGKCETLKIMCNSANSIHLVELGFQGAFVKKTFVRQEANLNLMDFDWKRDLIYWIDEHGLLKRSNESFGNLKVIHTGEAVCMAKVDIATGNIYWVPCQGKKICVTKHSGSGTKVIYLSSYIIQHLLLDWDTRLLYVVENGMSIQQMNLVGGDVQNLLNETNAIQQMSLDISSHSIMWKTEDFGLHTFGILKGKPSQLKDNFTSTLMDAFEPFILSYNDPFIEIWDRRTLKLFASVNETNLSKLVMVTSSHVRGSHSACVLNNGGCMLEEICISGSTNTVSCLCPDDKRTCSHGEETTEKLPVLEPLVCRRTFVPCRDAKACISIEFVCDGENDCFDGSDEEACTTLCSKQGIFRCVKGIKCIEAKHRCDGVPQCPDESDEENCWKPRESCAIRCDDNRCIPKSWICDGKPDCSDKSDENDCEPKQCSANQFRCNDGQCIPYSMHCDRDNDCEDHSDEQNCTVSKLVFCQRGQFKCQNGKCIPNEWKCDGATDCEDGSDERGCKLKKFICESAEWACTSQDQCVLSVWRCDGIKNCRDGSDELQCEAKNCSDGMFQCKSLDCIPSSFVCNGRHDCLDESDEGGKCGEPCEERCLLSCFRSPYGPKCTCEGGFRMSSNRSHCIDINECKELDPSPCSQSCINNHGSYTCTCHPGYSLQSDGHKCKVTGTEPLLLVSVRFSLLLYKLRTSDVEILTSTEKQSMIFSVDYDALDQKVFYVDHNAETIKWITMDTKVKRTLVKGVKSDCIAVDWIGRNLFWTDGTSGQILATALNATWKGLPEHVVVIDEYLDQPHALVLQPLSGLMYWSEIGVQPQIEEAGMDGSQRKILISEQLGWPTGLALDLLSWKIFWSDEKFRSIGSANLDGTNIKVIQMGAIQRPFALTVFEDEIYWSESEAQTVKKMNKNTATNVSVLIKRHEQPYGLKVIHEVLQPRMDNPCKTLKCSHVCLIGPSLNGSCWCPTGLVLSSNLLDCVPLKHMPFLMVALPKSIFQVILQTSELGYQKSATKTQTAAKTKIAALTNANQFSCFDYVFKDQTLVFAVKYGGYIASLKLSDGSLKDWKTIINVENSVTSVAVDWISGNIYWTSTARPLIQVATSNGRYRAVVIKDDLNKPICLTICPALGIMCYFDAGLGQENSAKIEFANMDGIDRKVLWRKSIAVVGLTLAISGTKLYWADEVHHTIESINVDGSNYKVLRSGLQGLDKFAAGNGVLFWTVYANSTTHVFFADLDMKDIKYFEMEQKVVDLKVYGKPTRQESNACSEKNGDCSQICLPNFEGRRKCRCSAHHYLINNTYCLEALKCPKGFHLCADGLQLQCVHQAYVCDGKQDCSDASDEKNCVHVSENTKYTSTSPLTTKRTTVKHMTYPRFRYSTKGKITLNRATTPVTSAPSTEFEDMDDELTVDGVGRILESKPCTRESCNMRGTCVVENGAVKCQCDEGYSGDYCQDGLSSLAPALTGSTIAVLLVFGIAAGVFVHISRRNALKRTLSSASSRTLTRQSAKDLFPLDSKHTESSETFLNEAFDAEGNTNTEQEHV